MIIFLKKLEKFLGIKISEEKKKEIIEETSIDKNRNRQDNVEIKDENRIFENYDKDSHIHANHISPVDPKPGYWKKIVHSDLHEAVEISLEKELKGWNYA